MMCHALLDEFDVLFASEIPWGGPPGLYVLVWPEGSTEDSVPLPVEMESFRQHASAGADPHDMLRQLVDGAARRLSPCPREVFGWLCTVQAWHLELRGESKVRSGRFRSRSGGGQYPEQVEARTTCLYTVDGEQAMLVVNRDLSGRRYHSTYERNLVGKPTAPLDGPIWDALKALTEATTPV